MNKKVQFKVALKRYLNAHSSFYVDKFMMFKIIQNILYILYFYDLFHILLSF
jgi:hypothetical protein